MRKTSIWVIVCTALFLVASALPSASWAQSETTGAVLGTVADPSGAAVVDATVVLRNTATNGQTTQSTNGGGQYTFVNVVPGVYEIAVKKDGFRTSNVSAFTVDVAKSYTVDVKLEIGQVTESITVSTEARVELQTTDAQIGDVIGGTTLSRLPTLTRDASELLTLQPGTTPYDTPANGGFGNNGGTVAGARSDQNAITMDGIDITDNTVGGGATAVNFIPTGVESLEEFRVGVTNSNIDFSRSSGGNITLISKSGSNTLHGDGYWFHQSDGYNANSWDLNHTADAATGKAFTRKSPFKDNREGVSVGGPIFKNKTFFFSNYEVRRFPSASQVSHIVPTTSLRDGILAFQDASGVVRQYNLATSTACGPTGTLACDPRGIGISPTIQALYKLNPAGNDPSLPGVDKNNTTGFVASASTPVKDDYVTFRLDHNFTDKMHFFGRYIYSRQLNVTSTQIDTLGNKTIATSGNDIRGDGAIGALDYAFNSSTSNNVRFGWIRSRVFLPGLSPSASAATLALAGTNTPAGFVAQAPGLFATGFLDVPIDVDTQRARTQGNFQRNKQLVDNFTHIMGRHTITAGGDVRWLPLIAQRNDKVVGSLASLVATEDADLNGTHLKIPAANRPPSCGGAVTTFCLQPTDVLRWDRLYAATLGLVDNVNVLAVRDGSLTAQPFGTPLIANTNQQAYDFYAQDTWRIKPTLTLTYGLGYGWQTPPTEAHGEQTFEINASNGQILTAAGYIQQKAQAAAAGQVFNPTIGYLPIKNSGRSRIWNTDYGDIAPRVSVAWNPSYKDGLLGNAFGAGKTVIRAGFGIYYDRINNVQSVEIPQLGVGFAQTLSIFAPQCNLNGASSQGAGCVVSGANSTVGSSSFRVGVDGTLPTPVPPAVSSPIIPGLGGEILSFAVDPNFKVGKSYSFDFTVQRELPGNMLMEIGYIGRLGRDLPNSVDFDSAPFTFLDKASGQTFAQAFSAIEKQLAAGTPATQVANQPWFENQLPGANILAKSSGGCADGTLSQTQCIVSANLGAFQSFSVGSVFGGIDAARAGLNLPTYNNHQIGAALFMRTHNDLSNYNAATITLRKRPSHGLQFDLNYTFSKSLDQVGTVQNNAGTYTTSFNPNYQYGPSLFDRTHVFNAIFNYDLPAGNGHKFSFGNNIANKIIGGWYVSGVFRAASGPPLTVANGDLGGGAFANGLSAIPLRNPGQLGAGLHGGVCSGTNGFGSNGNGPACAGAPSGTGLNLFANPDAAAAAFRAVDISTDGRDGTGSPLRGVGFWNLDSRLGKTTSFHERFKVEFSADFFNIFNHVNFFQPTLNLQSPATFGVISQELIPADRTQGSRWIQLGLRVSF